MEEPAFQVAPLEEEDDALIDQLLAENSQFQELLKKRQAERNISATEALRRL